MAAGFGISGGRIGACGDDKRARLFIENMSDSDVDISRMRRKKGSTGGRPETCSPGLQCACLVDAGGNRTMRPCLSTAVMFPVRRK
ncbi:unnamed protein product [Musa acuminata subsp. burmannicoides]